MRRGRLVAPSQGVNQNELEFQGDDGSITPLIAKIDPVSGKLELFDAALESEIDSLIEDE